MHDHLFDLTRRLLGEGRVEGVLKASLDGLIEVAGAERGLLLLLDDSGEVLFEEARMLSRRELERPELELSRSLVARVRNSGESFFHENVLADPELGDAESVRRLKVLSVICQPIRRGDEMLGLVYLDHRRAVGAFSRATAETVASFTEIIEAATGHALERRRLEAEANATLGEESSADFLFTEDPHTSSLLALLRRAADAAVPVLLRGETGTGKELAARLLHEAGMRRGKPFVTVHCGALPPHLIEAELFGVVRGAFTGADADRPGWLARARGGTLFLDEIAELPVALQPKLLRALESGEFSPVGGRTLLKTDARIVAATHRDLHSRMAEGLFRSDLYFRLSGLEVELPPLRARGRDGLLLARRFVARMSRELGVSRVLSSEAEAAIAGYSFPGNVRELKNAMLRAVLMAEGREIRSEDLPPVMLPLSAPRVELSFVLAKERAVTAFERRFLLDSLERSGGNIRRAARAAGLDYKNFYVKMKALGINPTELRVALD